PKRRVKSRLPFSSSNKFAGATLSDGTSYLLGAAEKLLVADNDEYREEIGRYFAEG
ncbi:MAG: hypothetical protein GX823_04265, partial [Clostridiales bacterium]|nr:hypothetical protein [Clostridiales bacterium]